MTPSVLHQLHRVSRDGFCRLVDKILESPPRGTGDKEM